MTTATNHTPADCTFVSDPSVCVSLSHRCPDCGVHVLPTYNDANELVDHACPSPSSNY